MSDSDIAGTSTGWSEHLERKVEGLEAEIERLRAVVDAAKWLESEVRARADSGTFSVEIEDAARSFCEALALQQENDDD